MRTLETWWYNYGRGGYTGVDGKNSWENAGSSRPIDPETGQWLLMQIAPPRVP